jgi:hypothetical protein
LDDLHSHLQELAGAAVSLFGPSNEEKWQALQLQAKGVFEVLGVVPQRGKRVQTGDCEWKDLPFPNSATWPAYAASPLELRDIIYRHIEDAASYYGTTLKDWKRYGVGESIQAFAVAVAFLQSIATRAYTDEWVSWQRVLTWYRIRNSLRRRTASVFFFVRQGDETVVDARRALGWFPDEVSLQGAHASMVKAGISVPVSEAFDYDAADTTPLSVAEFATLLAKAESVK